MAELSNLKINGTTATFRFHGPLNLANRLRQTFISQIPTWAIDKVTFITNTTGIHPTKLCDRLGLLPLIQSGEPTPLELSITAERNRYILSGELVGAMQSLEPELIICQLRQGQTLHFRAELKQGIGATHKKWSPVSVVWYKLGDIEDSYDFTLEAIGTMPVEEIVKQGMTLLQS